MLIERCTSATVAKRLPTTNRRSSGEAHRVFFQELDQGHTCADDAVELAMRAGVKHLFLFHHDPDHQDDKMLAMIARAEERVAAAGSPMLVSAAREGAEIVLGS
ncbi:MAG: hypothetical protein H0U23_07495 [Blastocatellia bacterium]|nr:hypothetical protein [Blastocatellia bacterium]